MWKKLLFIPALAIGVIAFMLMVRGRDGPATEIAEETPASVRTLEVPRVSVLPRAVGYGEVRPGRVWQAVPQVGGRIIELSSLVREGTFVPAETVLVRIDRSDSDLDVKVAESRIAALQAQLGENRSREGTTRASLGIEQASLELAKTELARVAKLVEKGTVPRADYDREQRSVLTQSLRVQEIENSLTLLEPQRAVIEAQIAQEQSQLEHARLAVERTVIRAPFECRIGPVSVEQDQVVQPGQVLFSADGTDVSEVTAWLPVRGMRRMFAAGAVKIDALAKDASIGDQLGLEATVRFAAGAQDVHWDGKVVRVRGIDSETRSLGLDVAVPTPFRDFEPSDSPPLAPGLYVEVQIRGRRHPDLVVVPRSAVHEDDVYIVGADSRLERRPVEIAFVQSSFAVVRRGLEGGETLVLTDLVPAVQGALLAPVGDDDARAALIADATGEADER